MGNCENRLSLAGGFHEIIYAPTSPLGPLLESIKRAAPSLLPILITGATGSGKENIARFIHANSSSPAGPFIDINCAAIPTELFESELFGHVQGAFTGAAKGRNGFMSLTEGGTLFLDELGEMPVNVLPKLLRAVETRTFRPVGSGETKQFRGRIIAATHRDLLSLSQENKFREDLFFRLAVFSFEVPSLRNRLQDIPYLVNHFMSLNKKDMHFTNEAMALLQACDWPGNVRELKNLISRLSFLADTSVITSQILEPFLPAKNSQVMGKACMLVEAVLDLPETENKLLLLEQLAIAGALRRCGGIKAHAARMLGVDRKIIERRLQRMTQIPLDAADAVTQAQEAIKLSQFKKAFALLQPYSTVNTDSLMPAIEKRLQCKIWYLLGVCHQMTSGWMSSDAIFFYNKAADLAKKCGDDEMVRSTKFMVWGSLLISLDLAKARLAANELMISTKSNGTLISRQEAYMAVANTAFWIGDCQDVINTLNECNTLLRPHADTTTLRKVELHSLGITFWGLAHFQLGFFSQAAESLNQLKTHAGSSNLVAMDRCFVFQGLSLLACVLEQWDVMGWAAAKLKKEADAINSRFYLGIGKFFHGRWVHEQGNVSAGEKEMIEGFDKYMLCDGGLLMQSLHAWQRGDLLLKQGRTEECLRLVSPAIEIAIQRHERVYLVELLELQARTYAALGDAHRARLGFENALSTAKLLGMMPGRIRAAAQLVRIQPAEPSSSLHGNGGIHPFNLNHDIDFESMEDQWDDVPPSLKHDLLFLRKISTTETRSLSTTFHKHSYNEGIKNG